MIQKIFNSSSKTIISAAVILGAASLVSRLLGLLRDRILASMFGAGDQLDVYYAAFRIPDLVYSLLIFGAISAGFIPVFISYLEKNNKKHWYLANDVVNLIALISLVVCFFLVIFAPLVVGLVAPGFSSEKLEQTVLLTRLMLLSPVFLGLSAVFGGILQSFRRFLIYSMAPIVYNIAIIFGALVLVKYWGLVGLAWGVVLGAFLHMSLQLFSAWQAGYRWQPIFDLRFSGLRRITKVMPPRVMSLALTQINFWAMTIFASFLAVGSITVFNLALNIWYFPLGVFGVSFVIASFPKLSEFAQKKDKFNFIKTFSFTARQILFFTLPAAVLFIVLRAQIVRVILGAGRFDWHDTVLTLQTLAYFSLSLFAEALILLFLRGFFAWEDTKTPFIIGLFATVVRLSSAWFLSKTMGVPGLALGFSVGNIVYLFFLFIALRRKVGSFDDRRLFSSGSKILLSSLAAGVFAYISLGLLSLLVDTSSGIGLFIQGGVAGIIGIAGYFLFSWIFGLEELGVFVSSFLRRLPLKRLPRITFGGPNGR